MSADQLVSQAVAVLLDVDAAELTGDSPLAAIEGWDSVNALRVLTYLERCLDVPLDYEHFHTASTVGDLVSVVQDAGAKRGAVR